MRRRGSPSGRALGVVLLLGWMASPVPTAAQAPFPGRPGGGSYLTRGDYLSAVQGRVALREDLETRWQDANNQVDQYQAALDRIRTDPVPSGVDGREWEEFRRGEIRRLENLVRQNEERLGSVRRRLQTVYGRLREDNEFLQKAGTGQLSSELGGLIGAGGAGLVPVWQRPTPGNLSRAAANARNLTELGKLSTRIPGLETDKFTRLNRLSATPPAAEPPWSTRINNSGNLELVHTSGRNVDLKIPAEVKDAQGRLVPNEQGLTQARAYTDLYTAREAVDASKVRLELERTRASDVKAVKEIDKQLGDLNNKRTELDRDIRKYENERAGKGPVKGLFASAAKWAAFSAGITVGAEVISQLSRNGWELGRVNWREAIAPITRADFWGGTAGSFALSMVASMIPGGTFVKTLASIGGAAVGWQLGSGNLGNTDWVRLGATTLGATLGSILGSALGPVGTIVGGIAGHMAANWLLGKLREWGEPEMVATDPTADGDGRYSETADPVANQADYLAQLAAGYRPASPGTSPSPGSGASRTGATGTIPDTSSGLAVGSGATVGPAPAAVTSSLSPAEIRREIDRLTAEIGALPPTTAENLRLLAEKQTTIESLNQALQQAREQTTPGSR